MLGCQLTRSDLDATCRMSAPSANPVPTTSGRHDDLDETTRTGVVVKRARSAAGVELIGSVCLLFDALCWAAAYTLMVWLRTLTEDAGLDTSLPSFQTSVCLTQLIALVIALFIVGGYDRRTNFLSLAYMSEHCIALLAAAIVGGLLIYAGAAYTQTLRPSRGVFLSSLVLFAPLSLFTRRRVGAALHDRLARSYFVVLGTGERARHFHRSYLASINREGLRFVDPAPSQGDRHPILDAADSVVPRIDASPRSQLAALARESRGIVVADHPHLLPADLVDWLTRLHYEDTPVYTLETFYEQHWRRVPVYAIDPIWPVQVGSQLTKTSPYSHAKRLFDVFAAGCGLAILSPIFVILGLIIALDSGRPVFFRQARVGRDRLAFLLYKFRTMHVRQPGGEGSLYTAANDPRITRVGYWLRKLRLDELPQLWNVFKGDMSLIGPRAEWDRLVDGYEKSIPCYHFRHLVKPGITGWAQVNYPYGASVEDAVQKLKYDLYYIRHYSLRLDAMIVLKTLHIMIWGKGQ